MYLSSSQLQVTDSSYHLLLVTAQVVTLTSWASEEWRCRQQPSVHAACSYVPKVMFLWISVTYERNGP